MPETTTFSATDIVLRGARVHNLQNIDVQIPRHQFTVITGVSGSGKSSLAFHTLFAEGQRRYLKSISGRTRNWLGLLPRPDVDVVEGIPPAIAVRQETPMPSARSTVANVTEMLDFLRVLYARRGVLYCPTCQQPVQAESTAEIADRILSFEPGTKVMLLAPVDLQGGAEDANATAALDRAAREGFVRGRIDGEIVELGEQSDGEVESASRIEIVVDRLILKEGLRSRLTESIEQTLRVGQGRCIAVVQQDGEWRDHSFQNELRCQGCSVVYPPLNPSLFSWSSARGACPVCEGAGYVETPSAETKKTKKRPATRKRSAESQAERETCPACAGARLNSVAANVRVGEQSLPQLLQMRLPAARGWLAELPSQEEPETQQTLQRLIDPLLSRLDFLDAVGVSYLSLNRTTETLSGGELQRVRLARCLGTQLQGSCYIVDEPTAGLHARDAERLLKTLLQMIDQGNTVVCVEHNLDLIAQADHLIELGPGGGRGGGQLLYAGTPQDLAGQKTATAIALEEAAAEQTSHNSSRAERNVDAKFIRLQNANRNTLKNVSVDVPFHSLVAVSGVSGSGKSTLILECLAPLLRQAINTDKAAVEHAEFGQLSLDHQFARLEVVDQRPAGKSARSCPATFSGMWDDVRKILARTRYSRVRGYDTKRFSLMSSTGVCGHCQGRGEIALQVAHLLENQVVCPVCRGDRFNSATLAVRYQRRSIADLLRMTIDEALDFWSEIQPIVQKLRPFQQIGLGYLSLGQSASSLSGGEAQRMKLARQLGTSQAEAVFILDEPTRGLHWADVGRLNAAFRNLVDLGNTVIVIEHHPRLLQEADWHVALGPGAGEEGGEVLHCSAERPVV